VKVRGQQWIDLVPLWKEIQHTVLYNTGAIGVLVSSLCKEGSENELWKGREY